MLKFIRSPDTLSIQIQIHLMLLFARQMYYITKISPCKCPKKSPRLLHAANRRGAKKGRISIHFLFCNC